MRPGNVFALTVLALAGIGLGTRAAVALSQDRPASPVTVANSSTIDVSGFAFPRAVTIGVGGTVTWVNRDGAAHTATFPKPPAPTPADVSLEPGGSATVTFASAGSYEYMCQIHPSMVGRVEVSASSQPTDPYATNPPATRGY